MSNPLHQALANAQLRPFWPGLTTKRRLTVYEGLFRLGPDLWRGCAYSQNFAFHPQMRGYALPAKRLS